MREQIKKLSGDSAVYGISSILGRFLNFLLVPFYTNFLPSASYGIVIVVYSYIAFLNVLFVFGLDTAYMRFIADAKPDAKKDTFSSPLLFIIAVGIAYATLLVLFATPIAGVLRIPVQWKSIVPIAAATLFVDALNIIPFASLRMDNKAKKFAFIKFASILLNVGLNIYFVGVLHKSIVSIFWAGLAASLLSTLLLVPDIFRKLHFKLKPEILKPLLLFGLPTIPAGLAAMVVQVLDKPIMQQLTDARTVGIYGANYKLGIFMMLIVSMFQYAWQPFFLQNASQANAKPLFARIMTYFVLFGMTVVLILSFFIQNAVTFPLFGHRYLIHPDYWSGLGIVPIILFSYIWTGMGMILNAGLLIEKRTAYLPLITGTGAAVNIVTNFWWIPLYGIFGGAFATLAAYMVMAILYWVVTLRFYRVPYEYFRLAKIGFSALIPALLWYLLPVTGISEILWKFILLGIYFLCLSSLGFFTLAERKELKRMLRLFSRSKARSES